LKRKEFATASAFDRDFNFITGIERYLERADRDAENRGIALESSADCRKLKRRQDPVKRVAELQRGFETCGVTVVKAPKGMSRSKQNMSYWHRKYVLKKLPFHDILKFSDLTFFLFFSF
jgi:hypothetical protein